MVDRRPEDDGVRLAQFPEKVGDARGVVIRLREKEKPKPSSEPKAEKAEK